MEIEINQVTPVEYELDVKATADELAPDIEKALRAQQANTDKKGFRPGKVPMSMVKKMYGQAVGYKVAEQKVQEVFEQEMQDSELDVIGRPTLTQLDYAVDEDLHAVVRFGVRPEVELRDLSEEEIDKLVYEVSDEDVEEELDQFRKQQADLAPLDEEAIDEDDYVTLDLQEIDKSTDTPIIGEKEEDVSFFLDDERLKAELREALLGKQAGDTFRVDLPFEDEEKASDSPLVGVGEEAAAGGHTTHRYEVTIKDAKRRDLPELDDAFVEEISNGQIDSVEELRDEIRQQLEHNWEHQAQEFLQSNIVERMLDLHQVPVPDSLVEMNLDALVEDVKERNDGELPEDFDETTFRQHNRDRAEKQGRWMLIRDQFIEDEGIEVEDDDLDEFFEHQSMHGQASADQLQQLYQSNPQIKSQIDQRVLGEKVFDALAERLKTVEKDHETLEKEMEEKQAALAAQQQGAPPQTP